MPGSPRIVAAAVLVLGLLASPASAALPRKGATYVGKVAGKVVTVKISKRSRLRGKYTYDCRATGGPVGSYTKFKIRRNGRFRGADKAGLGGNVDSLRGRFTSGRRARATFRVAICDGKGGKVSLRRK